MERTGAVLLVVWLALIGADRVDLLAGGGGFLLTPFLLLTPLVVGVEVARVVSRRSVLVPRGTAEYAIAVLGLLCVVLLSVLFSLDLEVALRRYLLLVAQILATLAVAIALANRGDARRILVGGAYAGLAVCIAFDLLQFASVFVDALSTGDEAIVQLSPSIYGFIPRLSGASLDANRGGLLIIVYLYFLISLSRPSLTRGVFIGLGSFALLLTLSRSAILAVLGVAAVVLVQRGVRLTRRTAVLWSITGAGVVLLFMLSLDAQRYAGVLMETLAPRLSLEEGSSSEHLEVMRRGWEVASRGPKQILLGIGYGNSFLALQEVYSGDKYGNFHSLYVTLLAESGAFALFFGLILLIRPLFMSHWLKPLAAGLIAFNVFYQSLVEPIFWLVLAMAWFYWPPGQRESAKGREAERPKIGTEGANAYGVRMR